MASTDERNGAPAAGDCGAHAKKAQPEAAGAPPTEKTQSEPSPETKGPAGGYDSTLPPRAPPGFTLKFTFHRATNLPFADINTLASDPYLLVQLNTSLPTRHKQDPRLRIRTPTIRRNVNPEWNCEWIVANVPADGFKLKARIYDEDPGNNDDRLGNVHVNVPQLAESWEGIREQAYSIKKRMGSKRAYLFRGCAAMFNRNVHMSGRLVISVELLGKTEGVPGGRLFTVGPCAWSKHYSPLFGRIAGTKDQSTQNGKKVDRYNFQANQIQLHGPVPEELYHRYVEFKPFIAGMFNSRSPQGWLLNRALHGQHSKIYHYDRETEYGSFQGPCKELTLKFLDLVHFDKGGRIYTYVLTLDALWRFTETGKEFGIDLLSKHTMHSDVSIYIAFSGEFFIRRLKKPWKAPEEQETHPPADIGNGPPDTEPPRDPAYYHLIIDNDSGTYRPNKDLLPLLKKYMERNLPGLKVSTLDCQGDAEKMGKMKNEQRERRNAEGANITYVQGDDSSSLSSEDLEDLDERAGSAGPTSRIKHLVNKAKQPGERFSDVVHGRQEVGHEPSEKGPLPSQGASKGGIDGSTQQSHPTSTQEEGSVGHVKAEGNTQAHKLSPAAAHENEKTLEPPPSSRPEPTGALS